MELQTDIDKPYHLVDSKVGMRDAFISLVEARTALWKWIELQRAAGEPVVEQPTGQWSDSRVTVWISDADHGIVKLKD